MPVAEYHSLEFSNTGLLNFLTLNYIAHVVAFSLSIRHFDFAKLPKGS